MVQKSSKRRVRKKHSRITSPLHRSPVIFKARAMEHGRFRSRRLRPVYVGTRAMLNGAANRRGPVILTSTSRGRMGSRKAAPRTSKSVESRCTSTRVRSLYGMERERCSSILSHQTP